MKQGAKTPQWNQSFWSKEKASNFARKKDISELDYLEVDQNLLPWDDQADGAIQDAQDDVRDTETSYFEPAGNEQCWY